MNYSQDGEDLCIAGYLRDAGIASGRLLDIGAFDGATCSNSRLFIEQGWRAVLVEASLVAFAELLERYAGDDAVELVHAAIDTTSALVPWHEHGPRAASGRRMASMASSTVTAQVEHMKLIQPPTSEGEWRRYWLATVSIPQLMRALPPPYAVVSIDTEGTSVEVLEAMDLGAMGTIVACVEHNAESSNVPAPSDADRQRVIAHCKKYGLGKVLFDNGVNVICAR